MKALNYFNNWESKRVEEQINRCNEVIEKNRVYLEQTHLLNCSGIDSKTAGVMVIGIEAYQKAVAEKAEAEKRLNSNY